MIDKGETKYWEETCPVSLIPSLIALAWDLNLAFELRIRF
jgi:hypothetical protein